MLVWQNIKLKVINIEDGMKINDRILNKKSYHLEAQNEA
jgi:hypothetical protein